MSWEREYRKNLPDKSIYNTDLYILSESLATQTELAISEMYTLLTDIMYAHENELESNPQERARLFLKQIDEIYARHYNRQSSSIETDVEARFGAWAFYALSTNFLDRFKNLNLQYYSSAKFSQQKQYLLKLNLIQHELQIVVSLIRRHLKTLKQTRYYKKYIEKQLEELKRSLDNKSKKKNLSNWATYFILELYKDKFNDKDFKLRKLDEIRRSLIYHGDNQVSRILRVDDALSELQSSLNENYIDIIDGLRNLKLLIKYNPYITKENVSINDYTSLQAVIQAYEESLLIISKFNEIKDKFDKVKEQQKDLDFVPDEMNTSIEYVQNRIDILYYGSSEETGSDINVRLAKELNHNLEKIIHASVKDFLLTQFKHALHYELDKVNNELLYLTLSVLENDNLYLEELEQLLQQVKRIKSKKFYGLIFDIYPQHNKGYFQKFFKNFVLHNLRLSKSSASYKILNDYLSKQRLMQHLFEEYLLDETIILKVEKLQGVIKDIEILPKIKHAEENGAVHNELYILYTTCDELLKAGKKTAIFNIIGGRFVLLNHLIQYSRKQNNELLYKILSEYKSLLLEVLKNKENN